jgi:plasmid stability protein
MANLTIKKLDDRILERLRAQAKKLGMSLNSYLRKTLAETVGLQPGVRTFDDLSDLAGSWTEEEAREFHENTMVFEEIDENLWK